MKLNYHRLKPGGVLVLLQRTRIGRGLCNKATAALQNKKIDTFLDRSLRFCTPPRRSLDQSHKGPLMKLTLIIVLVLGCAGIITFPTYSALQEKESKTQPKEVTLAKDSQSDKYAEVAFNHENHATKKYSPDGSAALTCVECHHTDQPAASLKPPLKTSECTTVLTAEELAGADSKPDRKS